MRFLLFFLLISQLLRMCRSAQIVYKFKNLECFPFPKYSENFSCLVKAVNWNRSVLEMDVDLKVPLRNLSAHLQFFRKGYNNRYSPFLINVELNLCDVISKRNFSPYGKIFLTELKKYTNLNHSCPISGHLMVRDFHMTESLWPVFPLGFYSISLKYIENFKNQASESVGNIKFYFESMEKVEIRRKPKV